MRQAALFKLLLTGAGLIALATGAALMKGGLYIGQHEGDALHLMQIIALMTEGAQPHRDFMTPIGMLAFWPIAALTGAGEAGRGAGMAFLLAQTMVALALLPALMWVAASRLRFWPAMLTVFAGLVLVLALVHGGTGRYVSVSMHYNRWAWAISLPLVLTAVLKPQYRRSALADGVLVGAGVLALMLLKVTYLIGLAPALLVALSMRRQVLTIGVAILIVALGIALVNQLYDVRFFWDYIGDLLTVVQSTTRPYPGEPWQALIWAPDHLAGTVVLIFGIVMLRHAGRRVEGMALILLAPGFIYITFQNYGNEPLWLMILAIILFSVPPVRKLTNAWGWEMKPAIRVAGLVALVLAAPAWINMSYSPFRHLLSAASDHVPMLPDLAIARDVHVRAARGEDAEARVAAGPMMGYPSAEETPAENAVVFLGERLPECRINQGLLATHRNYARTVAPYLGAAGDQVFVADIFSALWMMGAGAAPDGLAPWNYGQIQGFDTAEFLLVPRCATAPRLRRALLDQIESAHAARLTEIARTPALILYRIAPPRG
ncbi:hypothetical protein BV394_06340 [Brevirhabdus pacifica]|uniref:Uncharacterized protein n=1 Tax=Brevirhabdus pacifica TaxID=1267768 RepID=A0A1U7DHA9_9RHOB|nr:hypothetical protein [Brevirhabdus pacifica]APX89380.1 hypothetical protein BV394_06340 [Brevirhabdus pacifica]OWU76595.1 hypothetical protein ATO5_09950 [Loktanella sp. 22II-4b]PJJ85985.1 hypothetical protein CLV77_0517 [Brevirhabdus pacifica]